MGSSFLFPQPSFSTGAGRCLDLFGELDFYNQSPDGQTADFLALYGDWLAVGEDLEHAFANQDSRNAAQLELFEEV